MLSDATSPLLFCFVCVFIVFVVLHFYIIYCNKHINSEKNENDLEKNIAQPESDNILKKNIIYSLIESINFKQQQFFNS